MRLIHQGLKSMKRLALITVAAVVAISLLASTVVVLEAAADAPHRAGINGS
jgi:hypothetical protein